MRKGMTRREGRRNMKVRIIVTALAVSCAFGFLSCSQQRAAQTQRSQQASGAVGTTGNDATATAAPAGKVPETTALQQAAIDAYVYGYPLVTVETTRRVVTNVEKPDGFH